MPHVCEDEKTGKGYPTVTTPQIAIACQGGGSHTAFTAGVLKQMLEEQVHQEYRIVGLSGTSGGAICALLGWYGLLKDSDSDQAPRRLVEFWQDNATNKLWEKAFNRGVVGLMRLQGRGYLPSVAISPSNQVMSWMQDMLQTLSPRDEFTDFQELLEKYVAFDELGDLIGPSSPRLLLGAANVLNGDFKAFDSHQGEITVEAVQASAAIPSVFEAVHTNGGAYWDGLFSQNPPLANFVEEFSPDNRPDEIWIIQINPQTRAEVPDSSEDIADRHNEMMGNLSLNHEIRFVQARNQWMQTHADGAQSNGNGMQPVVLRRLFMSEELRRSLDESSKMDRGDDFIDDLIADGAQQAQRFLGNLDAHLIA